MNKLHNIIAKTLGLMASITLMPLLAICQTPPPPGGGNGGNPDEPLNGVPIDTNLTLLFVLVAVAFAFIVYRKVQLNKAGKAAA